MSLPSPLATKSRDRFGRLLVSPPGQAYIPAMNRGSFYSPQAGRMIEAPLKSLARFAIGNIVRHRLHDFRGVVFDIDPVFANSEEWYESIPAAVRPQRDQPFYHLLAESEDSSYVAYVSQQNLLEDSEGGPVDHPSIPQIFEEYADGHYRMRRGMTH
jgi:heat shock protein HspQ